MFSDLVTASFPAILAGLKLTLVITLASFVLGQLAALPLALAARSASRLLSWPARTYIFVVRGSPLLVQLFLVYYGLGTIEWVRDSILWPVLREPVGCAILAIGLNSAAYMGALLSGALAQLPPGLAEAARSLGLDRRQALTRVLLPVVYRQITPVLGNEMTLVLKASSLASTVTVLEITGAARKMVAQTFAPFEIFALAGLIYLLLGLTVAWAFRRIEGWLRVPGLGAARP